MSKRIIMNCKRITSENVRKFLDSFDTVLTDCDGVLWNGPIPIPGACASLKKFESLGKKIFYLSNNSRLTRKEYVVKCSKMGFPAKEENMLGSAYVTAQYLKNKLKYTGKAYVIGATGLQDELKAVGIDSTGAGPAIIGDMGFQDLASMELDPEVRCVVVGLDTDFSYLKMARASAYLQREGCIFVATNDDTGLPTGNGTVLPGAGAVLAGVQTTVGRKPDVICGKPSPLVYQVLSDTEKLDPKRTLMIGDRLNTDILLASNCGLTSLLVLTGVSSLEDVSAKSASDAVDDKREIPDYYVQSLGELNSLMEKAAE